MVGNSEFTLLILVFGTGILIFIIGNHLHLRKIPASKILIAGFLAFFTSWVFTVLEGFFWEKFFNLIEHIFFLVGSVLVVIWCWKIFVRKES